LRRQSSRGSVATRSSVIAPVSRPDAIGEVISLGRRQAVATIGGIELRGPAAALAKRAAAANYLRTLGGTALLDRIEWLGDPRFGTIGRGAEVSKR